MQRIYSRDCKNNIGNQVEIRGQLHTLRLVGSSLAFLIIRDAYGLAQIVLENPEEIQKLEGSMMGTVIYATGTIVEAPKTKFGAEMNQATVTVVRKVGYPSPIDISKETIAAEPETIHDNKVIALRHPRYTKIFRVAAIAEKHIRKFFDDNSFTQINSPKLIGFPTEGGAEIFELNYFDKKAYLAQSPQFYKQIMVPVFERVYEIGRAYRAEKSNTSRHMSEILMVDAEMGYIDSFNDVLVTAESFIKSVITGVWNDAEDLLTELQATKPLIDVTIPRFTLAEIHELYFQETGNDVRHEMDLMPAEEQFICDYAQKNHNSDLVFATGFPRDDAKFYHYRSKENPAVADRADLLFRGVELATITRREVGYDNLVQQMSEKGVNPENPGLKHYLDAFKYGMPESGGWGFGIARFVQKIIGLANAKDAELFPRDTNRVTP